MPAQFYKKRLQNLKIQNVLRAAELSGRNLSKDPYINQILNKNKSTLSIGVKSRSLAQNKMYLVETNTLPYDVSKYVSAVKTITP